MLARDRALRDAVFDIVGRRAPHLRPLLEPNVHMDANERGSIREVLVDELLTDGLRATSEPNDYGLLIEDAIDLIERW